MRTVRNRACPFGRSAQLLWLAAAPHVCSPWACRLSEDMRLVLRMVMVLGFRLQRQHPAPGRTQTSTPSLALKTPRVMSQDSFGGYLFEKLRQLKDMAPEERRLIFEAVESASKGLDPKPAAAKAKAKAKGKGKAKAKAAAA